LPADPEAGGGLIRAPIAPIVDEVTEPFLDGGIRTE